MEPPARCDSTAERPMSARSRRWPRRWRRAALTRRACGRRAGSRSGHRRLKIIDLSEAGAQPMVDSELGLAVAGTAASTTTSSCARELSGHGYRFFSHSDTEVLLKAYHHWGDRFVDRLYGHVRVRDRRAGQRPGAARPRPARHQAAVPDRGRRPRIRFASSLPALLAGGGVDTRIDPVALHHYLTFHSVVPPPRTILRGVTKVPPGDARRDRARRPHAPTTTYWAPDFTRRAGPRRLVRTGLGGRGSRVAAGRRRAPPGRRRAGGLPAVRRRRLQPDRRAARRGGPDTACRRSRSASSRSAASRATSSSTPTSSPSASAPTTTRSASAPTGCCPRSTARSAR